MASLFPIPYYGSKKRFVKHLLPLIPPHKKYIEVFGGAGALLFAKERTSFDIYNDLDSGIFTIFKVLSRSDTRKRFFEQIEWMGYSRKLFKDCEKTWESCEDDVDKAVKWFVVLAQSYNGCLSGWKCDTSAISIARKMPKCIASYLSVIERLNPTHGRLKGVLIENKSFRELIPEKDDPEAFFYCDPPYVGGTRKSRKVYNCEMTDKDHEYLVRILLRTKGKVMLSGYNHPIYGPLECAGWKRKDVDWRTPVSGKKASLNDNGEDPTARIESIWMNYDPEKINLN